MTYILAIRDNDADAPVSVDELTREELEDRFAKARMEYPPPQYEVMAAITPSKEMFLTSYPRFAGGGEE